MVSEEPVGDVMGPWLETSGLSRSQIETLRGKSRMLSSRTQSMLYDAVSGAETSGDLAKYSDKAAVIERMIEEAARNPGILETDIGGRSRLENIVSKASKGASPNKELEGYEVVRCNMCGKMFVRSVKKAGG